MNQTLAKSLEKKIKAFSFNSDEFVNVIDINDVEMILNVEQWDNFISCYQGKTSVITKEGKRVVYFSDIKRWLDDFDLQDKL